MYVRRVRGETLEFGHRGWLLDHSFIFYDQQSDSLWVQATGQCVRGKFKGEQLERVPVTQTTWSTWRSLHPQTLVLEKPADRVLAYKKDQYADYYARHGIRFGIAVFLDGRQKLYPLAELEDRAVVHDVIANRPVLVVFHAPSGSAVAWSPVLDDQELVFELVKVTDHDVQIRERGARQIWSGLSGRELDGGTRSLEQLRSTQFVVDHWAKHFPNSAVFVAP